MIKKEIYDNTAKSQIALVSLNPSPDQPICRLKFILGTHDEYKSMEHMNLAYSFLCIAKKSPFMIINFCNYPSIHLAEHETFVLVVTRLIVYLRLSLHFYGRPKIDNCVYQHGEQMPPCFGFTKSGWIPTYFFILSKKKWKLFFSFFVKLCLSTAFSFCLFSF